MNPWNFQVVFQCPECGATKTHAALSTSCPDLLCRNIQCHEGGADVMMVQLISPVIEEMWRKYWEERARSARERVAAQQRAQDELDAWG